MTQDPRLAPLENRLLQEIFACESPKAVEAAVAYASYLNAVGLTPENYPVFLSMLDIENHWVIDALIGDEDASRLLANVQPNAYIVERILTMVSRWVRGGIFSKNLAAILGVLRSVYRSPREGFEIHPLTISEVNAFAKHLDKKSGQEDSLNRAILDLLDSLGDAEVESVAVHASSIKNAFLDDRRKLEEVIPAELLAPVENPSEVAPRDRAPFVEEPAVRA